MRRWGIVGIGAATTVRAIATWLVLAAFVPSDLRRLLPLRRERRGYARAVARSRPARRGGVVRRAGRTLSAPVYVAALGGLALLQYGVFRLAVPAVGREARVARAAQPDVPAAPL